MKAILYTESRRLVSSSGDFSVEKRLLNTNPRDVARALRESMRDIAQHETGDPFAYEDRFESFVNEGFGEIRL